jgi:hypothetical protein
MRDDFVLNANDVAVLTQFANQGNNLSKLGWDLSMSETWAGIQWVYADNEYHVQRIEIDNLALTGDLKLTEMAHLSHLPFGNNNLTSVDVSDNELLISLFGRNAGINNLNISNTPTLLTLDIEDNYLRISDIIDDIYLIKARENACVRFENQRLPYSFNLTAPSLVFDEATRTIIMNTVQFTAEGTFPADVFIEIYVTDPFGEKTHIISNTVTINTSGIGIYSLAASPVSIGVDEYAEILVYTDNNGIQLITALVIRPAVFVF